MIDRGDIRQAIDRYAIWASLPGAGYGQFEHKADGLIAKFKKRAERSEIEYARRSPRLSPALVICIIVCLSRAVVITVITPATYKAQRDKNARELKQRTRQLLTCRCVSVMLLRSMQNTQELADAKAENDALRDDVAAGRHGCTSKQSVSRYVKPPPPPAWIMQPPPDWQTPLNGIISPSKRLITMQKQLKEPRSILMSSADGNLPISMGNSCNYCEQYTRASSGYNA